MGEEKTFHFTFRVYWLDSAISTSNHRPWAASARFFKGTATGGTSPRRVNYHGSVQSRNHISEGLFAVLEKSKR